MSADRTHSVKVPQLYRTAAKALREGRTVPGVSLDSIVRSLHQRQKGMVQKLLTETVKYEASLTEFLTRIGLFDDEPRLDRWLAIILFTELILNERQLKNGCKPVETVLKYYKKHRSEIDELKTSAQSQFKEVFSPRYVRINTLRLTTADAVRNFQDEGWNLIRCTSGSYDDYLRQLESLDEYDFIPDYHVKVVFAFHPKTSFTGSSAYENGEIFVQNKATCLAPHILAPTPGSTVLDMCAAPGMKTTHLAAIMKNEGTIYSIEQDKSRYDVLCKFVETSGASCVQVMNRDAAKITKIDCPNVDYVLLDPSCSGSGINRIGGNNAELDLKSGRLEKLSAFQAKLLRHALNEFKTAKRIVYSTCSLYPQENEEVVKDVLDNYKGRFKLVSVSDLLNNKWNNFGSIKYEKIGEKCLYARPESDYTIGFFIAVFERSEKQIIDDNAVVKDKKPKGTEINGDSKCNDVNESALLEDEIKTKKSKKKKREIEEVIAVDEPQEKKKKKKRKIEDVDPIDEVQGVDDNIEETVIRKSKKKNKGQVDVEIADDEGLQPKKKKKKSKSKA